LGGIFQQLIINNNSALFALRAFEFLVRVLSKHKNNTSKKQDFIIIWAVTHGRLCTDGVKCMIFTRGTYYFLNDPTILIEKSRKCVFMVFEVCSFLDNRDGFFSSYMIIVKKADNHFWFHSCFNPTERWWAELGRKV
jgi:hypothetical protein